MHLLMMIHICRLEFHCGIKVTGLLGLSEEYFKY